jgi:O-antigen/teichoic acid export membrane protein
MIDPLRRLVARLVPRGVGSLAGANLASQLCTLAAMPLLTRWCSVSDFGLLQVYLTISTVAGLVACLRFDQAVLQPADHDTAGRLGVLSLLASLGAGALMLAVVPALAWTLRTQGWREVSHLTPLVALAVAMTGMSTAATQWLVRLGNFKSIAQARLVQSVCAASCQVGGSLIGLGGVGLILGDAIGRLVGFTVLQRASLFARYLPRRRMDYAAVGRLAREYQRFAWIATPSALISALGLSLPVVIVERAYGTDGLGVYSLLDRVMNVPTLFVGWPLSQTFTHRLREALVRGAAAARAAIRETAEIAALLGIVPYLALALAGPFLVTTVFGERWRLTGQLAQLLALPYGVTYVLWPVMPTLMVLNRLRAQFVWDAGRVLALLALLWIVSQGQLSLRTTIATITVVMAGFGMIHYRLCLAAVKE